MNIKVALKSDRLCRSLIGLSIEEFKALIPEFENNYWESRIRGKKNKNIARCGRKGRLISVEDKLFVVLMYLKIYPTFDLLGFMLDLNRSNTCRDISNLLPILEQTLKRKLVLPERKISTMEEFLKTNPEIKDIFIDGTERKIRRPTDRKKRKKLYSGKAKSTTRKNIVVADEKKKVLVLTKSKSGRRHDKRHLDKNDIVRNIPPDITVFADTAFRGIEKVHPNSYIARRAYKNKPLTEDDKEYNKFVSSFRIVVEHAICGIKRMNCVNQAYRNHKANFDDTLMLLSTGIWNYHLQYK